MEEYDNLKTIIRRYLQGVSSEEELSKAISLFSNPIYNSQIKSELQEFWNDDQFDFKYDSVKRDDDNTMKILHRKIEKDHPGWKRTNTKRILLWSARIAAVFVLGFFIGMGGQRLLDADKSMTSIFAPQGSISQMVLPDSTIVYLNSDSEIRYTPGLFRRSREVELNGEAWFQVTKNQKKPFILHTDSYDVIVTGTEFNVKAYSNEQEVVTTLEEGSVVIPSTRSFKMKADRKLEPGQQFIFNREKRVANVNNVETRYFTAWKDNKLIFINMSLEKLQILLERKYGVDIEIRDRSLLDYHYDGTFKNESILEIMELLKITLPIDYRIIDQKIEIYNETEKQQPLPY